MLTRKEIFHEIQRHLDAIKQWQHVPDNFDWAANVVRYTAKAEALIELMEGHIYGSHGGHGGGHHGSQHLNERFQWLKEAPDPGTH